MKAGRRGARLGIGDRVRVDDMGHTVIGISGTRIRLADATGNVVAATVSELLSDERFALADLKTREVRRSTAILDTVPAAAAEEAAWWEAHLAEVVYGVRSDAPSGTAPLPEYDPALHGMAAREKTKAAELTAAGKPVSALTLRHRRQRWEAHCLAGLVDHRLLRPSRTSGRVRPEVVEAMCQAINEAKNDSSRAATFVLWRTRELLGAGARDFRVPSRATLYRLFRNLSNGKHTTGSASTRRGLAGRPTGMFGQVHPAAPGELMQIDSTPIDVMVLLDDGVPGRVELTGMIDVATRTITAAVIRPNTKSVDATVLLARTVTPEPMRPGWSKALAMAHSALPYDRLLTVDERLEHAAAKPVIVPDTIVYDHGSVYISANFRASCRHLGISLQPAHLATGSDKPHIERAFGSIGSLFCQFVSGYVGRNVDRRGRGVEDKPLWSLHELQELLDEWLIAVWQNREHDGLRDPEHPARRFTPNEKYAALVEAAGYVPVALSADDYIELLPACWRSVNAYGVKINHRIYDAEALHPLRLQPSGVREHKDRWEIRHDPYDISRIHIRGRDGWITVLWRYLDRVPAPFGELAWDHARQRLQRSGQDTTEGQIADEVNALLRRAHLGPDPVTTKDNPEKLSKRDRRVVAHTTSTAAPQRALRVDPRPTTTDSADPSPAERPAPSAKVIPLGVFDAFEEAEKPW